MSIIQSLIVNIDTFILANNEMDKQKSKGDKISDKVRKIAAHS